MSNPKPQGPAGPDVFQKGYSGSTKVSTPPPTGVTGVSAVQFVISGNAKKDSGKPMPPWLKPKDDKKKKKDDKSCK